MGLYLISSSPEREMNVCMRKGDGVTRREEQTRLAQKSSTNKVQTKTFPLMRGTVRKGTCNRYPSRRHTKHAGGARANREAGRKREQGPLLSFL